MLAIITFSASHQIIVTSNEAIFTVGKSFNFYYHLFILSFSLSHLLRLELVKAHAFIYCQIFDNFFNYWYFAYLTQHNTMCSYACSLGLYKVNWYRFHKCHQFWHFMDKTLAIYYWFVLIIFLFFVTSNSFVFWVSQPLIVVNWVSFVYVNYSKSDVCW